MICLYRFFTWQSAPKNLEWSLFPLPKNFYDKVLIMVEEILFMKLIYKNNKKLWLQSLILHYGFYLIIFWVLLTFLGLKASIVGVVASYLMLIGAIILFLCRCFIKDLKIVSHANQFFNLTIIIILSILLIYSNFFYILKSQFLYNIITFNGKDVVLSQDLIFYYTLLLIQLFLIYIPSSSMVHFFAKYFTWDKIRWNSH
jgi:nitrate reductase gamma subunit